MNEIWPEGKTRRELENRIYELAEAVPVGDSTKGEFDWLFSHELDEFIEAWYTLAKYYEINPDTVIGVEVVSEYVSYARLFTRLMHDHSLEAKFRQQAQDQMSTLDAYMDELISQAVSKLSN